MAKIIRTEKNYNRVMELLEADPYLTDQEIADRLSESTGTLISVGTARNLRLYGPVKPQKAINDMRAKKGESKKRRA